MRPVCGVRREHLLAVSVVGGLIGGVLLLSTPSRAFDFILPWLMLIAALLQLGFQYLAASLRAFGRFGAVSTGTAIQALLGGGLGLVLVWPQGAMGLVIGWIAGTAVALLVMGRGAREVPFVPGDFGAGLRLARAGGWIFATYTLTLLLRSVDRLALVRHGTPSDLGLYSLGLMATGLVLYLPEAIGYVLFPRMAAAHSAADRARALTQVLQAQRSLAVVVPFLVGLGMVTADTAIHAFLPAYQGAAPSLRVLALGAMMLSAATVPGYFLLATGRQRRLAIVAAVAAAVTAGLVFAIAARDPRPVPVAIASATGYALYALAALILAAREWLAGAMERARLVARTLVPAAWAGGTAIALCALRPGAGWTDALGRVALFAVLGAPVVWWFARGSGLSTLAREWRRKKEAT